MKLNLTVEEAAALHGIATAAVEMKRFESLRPGLRKAIARLEGAIERAGGHKITDGWMLRRDRIRYEPANVEFRQEEAIPLARMTDLLLLGNGDFEMRKVLARAQVKLAAALERAGVKVLLEKG